MSNNKINVTNITFRILDLTNKSVKIEKEIMLKWYEVERNNPNKYMNSDFLSQCPKYGMNGNKIRKATKFLI